jgi:hypothetical protein
MPYLLGRCEQSFYFFVCHLLMVYLQYQPADPVMKLGDCRHWLHKECLEQWLKGASTCPVCRKDVKGKGKRVHRHDHSGSDPSRRRDSDGPDGPGGPSTSGGGSGSGGDIPHANWLNFLRD